MAQHDYVISNGTGAAVRSDLNGALAAIVSQNSGAIEPAVTYAYMPWADTTAGVYKIRNSSNNGWITLFQLDGEWTSIAFENGSAAAPSVYFKDSGTDTGFYSSGTDAVDVTTGGTRRFGWGSTGDVTVYGGNLTLNAQGDLRFADSDSSNWVAFQSPATVSTNVTWTLPNADGSSGQALSTNGTGTLSWASYPGLDTAQTWTRGQRGEVTALTSATTVTPDFADSNNFSLTLGHNVTLANPSNLVAGQSGVIFITQGASTAYTMSFGSYWDFSGGTAPAVTTTLSAVDCLVYAVRSATSIHAQLITNLS